MKYSTN